MSYVYVCAGCDLLGEAERSDCMTCSPACRVRAHRSGEIKRLREIAEQIRVSPASILHAKALERLLPDRVDEMIVRMGEQPIMDQVRGISWFDNQPDIRKAFYALIYKQINEEREAKEAA